MALLKITFLSSVFFIILIWLFFTGKTILGNLKKERSVLCSLNKELKELRSEVNHFKEDVEYLKKKIVDKMQH